VAPDAAKGARRRPKRRGSLLRPIATGLVLLVLVAVGLLMVVPLRAYTAKVEQAMSTWLNDTVKIDAMVFRPFPTPHLQVRNVSVGPLLAATAPEGRIYLDITTLLGDRLAINAVELDGLKLSAEAVNRIPLWGNPKGKSGGGINRITLKNAKVEVKPALEAFSASILFRPDGVMREASLAATGWSVVLKPSEKGFDFDATLRNIALPLGAPIMVNDVRLKGAWSGNEIVVPEFEAEALEGKVNGTLRITWGTGVKLESDLALARVNVQQLVGAFTKAIVITGKADGNFAFATEGPTLEQLFAQPRAQGKFRVADGTISNVDLVAVMQSDSAGQRAGVTKFVELAGELAAADNRVNFRQLTLQGGVLRGNGNVDLGGNGALAGRVGLEIRSQVAQDRGSFTVSGTVGRPSIRRGG
jgi:uncharacterized protein involved in outer membrane biogenesis